MSAHNMPGSPSDNAARTAENVAAGKVSPWPWLTWMVIAVAVAAIMISDHHKRVEQAKVKSQACLAVQQQLMEHAKLTFVDILHQPIPEKYWERWEGMCR